MIIDAREVFQGTEIETDLCIVGAGAAGITIARAFDGTNIRVCLIESGGLQFDVEKNSLYEAKNIGHPYWPLHENQMRVFGGNTNCWGGWCRPLDEIDFESRSWVPWSGWPFPASELAPHYRSAHEILQIRSDSYDPTGAVAELTGPQARILPVDASQLDTIMYRFSPPTRFVNVYLDGIRNSNNIQCYLHANVLNIGANDDATEIERITVGCLNGNRFSVRAKRFVLSAGGTENPRLLLNSRDRAVNGLGNGQDLVGRFFMEHPQTKRRLIPLKRGTPLSLYGLHFYAQGISARLALPPALQEREKLLNYTANIHPVFLGNGSEGWIALRKVVLAISPARRGDPFLRAVPYGPKRITPMDIWRIARTLPQTTIGGFLQQFRPNRFITGYLLESKSEPVPNPDSRITLQDEKDPFGMNRVCLDWRTVPFDRQSVIRAEQIVDGELRRLNIGSLEPLTDEELVAWPASGLEGAWHQLGTTRMHDEPSKGVVDRNCRVHGISNLFVSGQSVFPTVGASPPTLTVVALAVRLAEHLRGCFA
jgi:choline dehydrogenase-like flavoprotein